VRFNYHDRHSLKGVIRDRPYPIFSLDAERLHSRRQMRDLEDKIKGQPTRHSTEIREFLAHFMRHEGIERPHLQKSDESYSAPLPESYAKYRDAWLEDAQALSRQLNVQRMGEADDAAGGEELPSEVVQGLTDTMQHIPSEGPGT
jgi:hypothetical protein